MEFMKWNIELEVKGLNQDTIHLPHKPAWVDFHGLCQCIILFPESARYLVVDNWTVRYVIF